MTTAILCDHCLLPLGRSAIGREIDGEHHGFCCYGCYLVYRMHHGRPEEADATWLLIRLGIGAFLAMNLMLFTLLDYSRVLERTAPELRPAVHVLLWALA
ncbi:MAG TPA: heavy metal translocating P-type ATPase metal-binding domain-containing protein, partial [Candidatus Omnitrophota bacterium]|nr:heavy metal translocating P-type ATPase metal-binding domain-containing protein [Candidatus Omnitrophota bacterium]